MPEPVEPHQDDWDLARLVPLAAARPLTAAERAWVERLAGVLDLEGLDVHVASAAVTAACSCGCASVGLASHGPSFIPESIARLTDGQRDDYLSSEQSFLNERRQEVEVILHISTEGLFELEVWSALHGRDAATELPLPTR